MALRIVGASRRRSTVKHHGPPHSRISSRRQKMLKPLMPSTSIFTSFTSPKGSKPPSLASEAIPSLVAGMDISEWDTFDVTAAPGSLGIQLDGNYQDAAVLEGFAPISSDGTKGAVELDGRVMPGSVLIAVNDMDLLEHKLTLQEVGRVLRDTQHQVRTLRFRVPPLRVLDASEASVLSNSAVSETDQRVLLKGMDKSSYKEKGSADEGKRSWNFKSMLSPSQLAGSVMALSGYGASDPVAPSTPTNVEPTHDTPKAVHFDAHQSPVDTDVRSPALTASPRSMQATNTLAAKIPPGPIGLNLDGDIQDRAVVVGFLPLADGSIGELERRGDIPPGSVLVAINGSSLTHLNLDEIRARLGALAGFERELVFDLPPPQEGDGTPGVMTAKQRAAAFERLGDLDKRRKMELANVLKYDKTSIKRHECWILIETNWMMKWIEFTAKGGVSPGPITNYTLLETNWKERVSGLAPGRPDAPRAGLQLMKDYRCVTPMVWALFAELYGNNALPSDPSLEATPIPVQARYVLDAYAEPLTDVDITSILLQPRLQAAAIANDLRERFPTAFN